MSDENYEQQISQLKYEIEKYKKAITDSGLDYYDFNLDTGDAEQSFIIGKALGLEPHEYDTMEKRSTHFHPDDLQRNYEEINRIIRGEIDQFDVQSRLFRKDGGLLWLQHSGTLSRHPVTHENHLVGMLRDITQEKSYLEKLQYLADYDGLTGTYNRRTGLIKLEEDISAYDSITIIYMDIDKFKSINDTYGHSTGDRAIKVFSEKITASLPKDAYLIRLGGDEFLCVLLNQFSSTASEALATLISNPVQYGNKPSDILFFSYGIVTFDPCKHESVDELIREADEQMYAFKRNRLREDGLSSNS